MSQLKKTLKRGMVIGVRVVKFKNDKLCSECQARKHCATSHPMKAYLSTFGNLEIQHMDLFEPTTLNVPLGPLVGFGC
jgi:hypothetical protein